MRYLKTIGLAFAAVLALSAVSAAGASASEFKTAAFPVSFSGEGAAGELTTAKHEPIKCEKSKSSGEVVSKILADKIVVTYEKCTTKEGIFTVACENAGAGIIKTNPITAEPVDLGGAGVGPVGLELKPESGTVFAEFTCGGIVKVTVSNSVICESLGASVGKLATTGELACVQEAPGVQKRRKANGSTTELLLSVKVGTEPEEPGAINTQEKLTFTKEIEQTTP